jgi:hypothetical protein
MNCSFSSGRVALFSVLLVIPAHAYSAGVAVTVDFENDPVHFPPDNIFVDEFVSDDSPHVAFTSTVEGGGVQVRGDAPELMGRTGILPRGPVSVFVPSGLKMSFARPVTALSILFGNDDPGPLFTEDRTLLEVFSGNTSVGQTIVMFNGNDLADQTISIDTGGTPTFDMATLTYVDSTLQAQSPLAEFVDEITFTLIPEPHTANMLFAALMICTSVRARKERSSFS